MNYIGMRRGNKMPAVGVLQTLLNASGASLGVDGDFGSKTYAAVKDYQRSRKLGVDGVVGKNTWTRITSGFPLKIGDSIDIWEKVGSKEWAPEYNDIRNTGSNPFIAPPTCGGNPKDIIADLTRHYAGMNLFLLRFHGHGNSGGQQIFGGLTGITNEYSGDVDVGEMRGGWFDHQNVRDAFRLMYPNFASYGSIQLNGCRVGSGPDGWKLLTGMANAVGVPVTAGVRTQYAGGKSATFYMEGQLRTAVPGGKSLKSWCAAIPEIKMSLA